jgi:hypothetical protein
MRLSQKGSGASVDQEIEDSGLAELAELWCHYGTEIGPVSQCSQVIVKRFAGTRDWLLLDLVQTPDDRVPIFFTNGSQHGLTFATRDPEGFGEQGLRVLRFVMPTIAAMMEIRVLHLHLDNVLRIYVGDEPHRAILSGTIRRGQVARIHSAILFADMRDYTARPV